MKKYIAVLLAVLPFGLIVLSIFAAYKIYKNSNYIKKKIFNMDSEMKYFLWSEFDSPATTEDKKHYKAYPRNGKMYITDSGYNNMDRSFIAVLEQARENIEKYNEAYGTKIVFSINSGYRTQAYNDTLPNSVTDSAHVSGQAADIAIHKYTQSEKAVILDILRKHFVRIGKSATFYHVDNSTTKPQNEWTY